jgi:hypothetical protein
VHVTANAAKNAHRLQYGWINRNTRVKSEACIEYTTEFEETYELQTLPTDLPTLQVVHASAIQIQRPLVVYRYGDTRSIGYNYIHEVCIVQRVEMMDGKSQTCSSFPIEKKTWITNKSVLCCRIQTALSACQHFQTGYRPIDFV